ncbi:MAG: ChaN family lipoprotein [Magnetococcales bacterium]|nr:ChaN family lipoprotein [Magnetococcales bacterium]
MVQVALLALFSLVSILMAGPIDIDHREIVRAVDRTTIDESTLIQEAQDKQVVLVGESHTNPHHHAIQLSIIKKSYESNPNLAVGMEMFPKDLQPELDRWVAGELEEEAFLDAVSWYFTWGYDADLYLPILRFVKEKGIPLFAMNVRREVVRAVRMQGMAQLAREIRNQLPEIAPASGAYRGYLSEIFESHPMMAGKMRFDYFVEAQQVWDGVMADAIVNWLADHPEAQVVGLAGSGHLLQGFGIPYQLEHRGVDQVVTVIPWSVGGDWAPGDAGTYVWGTQESPDTLPPVRLGIHLVEEDGSVKIEKISEKSIAATSDLQAGDRIQRLNDIPIQTSHALVRLLRGVAWGDRLILDILRKDQPIQIHIELPSSPPPPSHMG